MNFKRISWAIIVCCIVCGIIFNANFKNTAFALEKNSSIKEEAAVEETKKVGNETSSSSEVVATMNASKSDKTKENSRTGIKRTLTQDQLVYWICEKNYNIKNKKQGWKVASEQVKREKGIFEPDLVASYNYKDSFTPNTATDYFDRNYLDEYNEMTSQYKFGIEGKLLYGTKYNIRYTLNDISNDLVEEKYDSQDTEYSTNVGVQITQPLLQGFGPTATKSRICIAKADRDISFQEYRQSITQTVAKSLKRYWRLYYAHKQFEYHKRSVEMIENILETNRRRVQKGKMSKTELAEVKAGLALRRSLLSEADQKLLSASNDIDTLLSQARSRGKKHFIPIDSPVPSHLEQGLHKDQILKQAFLNRPVYLKNLIEMDKQDVRIAYAKNQCWPEVNLKASYGLNGLDVDAADANEQLWKDETYDTWSVGFEVRVPLFGGIDSSSELSAVKHKKRQALYKTKNIQVQLRNQVDTRINSIVQARNQVQLQKENVDINRGLFEVEKKRLSSGQSNSQEVLEREKKLIEALKGKVKAVVNLEVLYVDLLSTKGTLLDSYNIEIAQGNKAYFQDLKSEIKEKLASINKKQNIHEENKLKKVENISEKHEKDSQVEIKDKPAKTVESKLEKKAAESSASKHDTNNGTEKKEKIKKTDYKKTKKKKDAAKESVSKDVTNGTELKENNQNLGKKQKTEKKNSGAKKKEAGSVSISGKVNKGVENFIQKTKLCTKSLLVDFEHIRKVKSEALNLRKGPSRDSKILSKLNKNDFLLVIDKNEGWYKILNKKCNVGWVAGYLTQKVEQ